MSLARKVMIQHDGHFFVMSFFILYLFGAYQCMLFDDILFSLCADVMATCSFVIHISCEMIFPLIRGTGTTISWSNRRYDIKVLHDSQFYTFFLYFFHFKI